MLSLIYLKCVLVERPYFESEINSRVKETENLTSCGSEGSYEEAPKLK